MRIGSFKKDGRICLGVFENDCVLDLHAGYATLLRELGAVDPARRAVAELSTSALGFIDAGPSALDAARRTLDLADRLGFGSLDWVYPQSSVQFVAPHQPRKIVCTGTNYEDYRKIIGIPYAPVPLIFMKSPTAVIGHEETVYLPTGYGVFYHEWELSCVISKPCRKVAPDEVNDYIFGYTILNDITGRSLEATNRELQPLGKNMDTFAPFGPWIVTPETMPDDLYALRTLRRRNGKIECDSNTSNMRLGFEEIISYCSNFFTLLPGDIVSTATPPAGGFYPGDIIEAEIEGIGVLRNPVKGIEVDVRYAREIELKEVV